MRALEGVKVIDLSRYISGPYCSKILGDLGADVIKVETPGGEFIRGLAPQYEGENLYYLLMNRNKRGITVNTRTQEGKEILRKLFLEADVVVQNLRLGVMEKMGFGWETLHQLNPKLILVSITAYGDKGPWAHDPGYDLLTQAFSGLMDKTGDPGGPPYCAGAFVVDYCTATNAALGAVTALSVREKTGKGQHVKLSLLQTAITFQHDAISEYLTLGTWRSRIGNTDIYSSPVNSYRTSDDRYICLIAGSDNFWNACMEGIGRPDLIGESRFKTGADRKHCADEIEKIVSEWALQHTADECVAIMREKGVPVSKVNTVPELVENEQVKANNLIVNVPCSGIPDVPQQGFVMDMSDTPMSVTRGAPNLGEHSQEVLLELGYSNSEIIEFERRKII